ncbi:MAG: pilus assembly protein PilP [Methylococcales bacterium]|nr:pilus assembly protein PilP [Methylococcales bacterium]
MKLSPLSMIKPIRFGCFCVFFMLSACSDNDVSDLDTFIEEVEARPSEGIEPLEAIAENDFFYFELDDSRDPFLIIKDKEEEVEDVNLSKPVSNGIKPDFTRIKEDLESFPLDALNMVGTVKKGMLWGLIRSEEGVQRVKIGNYIGQNHGKIINISATEIKLEEIIKDEESETDAWIKKEAILPLNMGTDE